MDVTCHLSLITLQLSPHLRLLLSLPSLLQEAETAREHARAPWHPASARPEALNLFFYDLFITSCLLEKHTFRVQRPRPLPDMLARCVQHLTGRAAQRLPVGCSVGVTCSGDAAWAGHVLLIRTMELELYILSSAHVTSCHVVGA